jgi:glycosyltransferase involved in cell wall biosynthesis
MPSLYEGLGLSLQEALFQGCACVASRVGGIPELIEDGVNGLLVPPRDTNALAAGLDRLINDDVLRRTLSERAPMSMLQKGMNAKQMVRRYTVLYQGILGY